MHSLVPYASWTLAFLLNEMTIGQLCEGTLPRIMEINRNRRPTSGSGPASAPPHTCLLPSGSEIMQNNGELGD